MSDKIILSCVILAAVFSVAVLFIRRARGYKKRMRQVLDAPVLAPESPDSPESAPHQAVEHLSPQSSGQDIYLARFICLLRQPFHSRQSVRIRPEYYERIKKIAFVIGQNDVTVISYLDKVLKAHFDDNRDAINALYKERGGELFNPSER